MPDFIALRGDPSDGLPGAKGVGEKTAADLLRKPRLARGRARRGDRRDAARSCGSRSSTAATSCSPSSEIATLQDAGVKRPRIAPPISPAGAKAAREQGMNALAKRLDGMQG